MDEYVKRVLKPKYLIFKSELVYYINPNKITIGILEKNALFVPRYIFDFVQNIEISELDKLISTPINDYIIQKKCDPNQENQQILNEEDEPIGFLIILNKNFPLHRRSCSIDVKEYKIMESKYKNEINRLINKNNNLLNRINYLKQELNVTSLQNINRI